MSERLPPYSKLTNAPGGDARGSYAKSPLEREGADLPPHLLQVLLALQHLPPHVVARILRLLRMTR